MSNEKHCENLIKIFLYIISLNLLFILTIIKIIIINIQKLYINQNFNIKNFKLFLISFNINELNFENLYLLIFCVLLFLISELLFLIVRSKYFKKSSNIPVKITHLEKKDSESITFLVTYIVPLLFIDFRKWDEIIMAILILFIIGIMSIKTDLYLSNPTLSLKGFKIYRVSVAINSIENTIPKTILSLEELEEGDEIKYINLSDDEYYVIS